MTTEKPNLPDAYFNVTLPEVGTIRVRRHDNERYGTEAVVYFAADLNVHVRTPAKARELLAAAFEALRILDPDGAVICRASSQAIYALEEILPIRVREPAGCELDECDCQAAPFTSPDLVIPPAVKADGCDCGGNSTGHLIGCALMAPAAVPDVAQAADISSALPGETAAQAFERRRTLSPEENKRAQAPYPGFPERYPSGADSVFTEDGSLPDVVFIETKDGPQ